MIVVTGMHRSGTSCIAGLLSLCGFSLGTSHPLLNESRPDNAKGHFENLGAVAINERILRYAGGSWDNPPPEEAIAKADKTFSQEIRDFLEAFNGRLFKDPRICLTISIWERLWASKLESIVLCLRHPMSVAISLNKRNGIPIGAGLDLWTRYNTSIMEGVSKIPLIVVDYDNLRSNLLFELRCLTHALGNMLSEDELAELSNGFYNDEMNHAPLEQERDVGLPHQTEVLYRVIRARTFSLSKRDGVLRQGWYGMLSKDFFRKKTLAHILFSSARHLSKTVAYFRSRRTFHS